MSTYIQGIDEYIPQIQQYQADYTFYANAIQMKNSQYEAAKKKLANVYDSILNNPMLRDEDIEKRKEFFDIIDKDIKKISTLDLSLEQNQVEANHLFSQLLDDKNIAHDMVFTKKAQSALQLGESLRSLGDNGYWSGMSENIQYAMKKYQEANNNKALTMSAPEYIKKVDISEDIIKNLKNIDFDVTEESPYVQVGYNADGSPNMVESQWIIKKKNGALVEPYLQAMFTAQYASRGDVQDYYNELAKNQRIRYVSQKAEEFGSEEAANEMYVKESINALDQIWKSQGDSVKGMISNIDSQLKSKNTQLKKVKSSNLGQEYIDEINSEIEELEQQRELLSQYKDYSSIQMNKIMNSQGELSPEAVDSLYSGVFINNDIAEAAKVASMKGYEQIYKENPYYMERMKEAFQIKKMSEEYKLKTQLEKDKIDYKMKKEAEKEAAESAMFDQVFPVYGKPGSVEENIKAPGYNVMEDFVDTQSDAMKASGLTDKQSVVLNDAISELQQIAKDENNSESWRAKEVLGKIYSRSLSTDEVKNLQKDNGNDWKAWYSALNRDNYDVSNLDPYMIDNAYKVLNEDNAVWTLLKDTRAKNGNYIGDINTIKTSYDVMWNENRHMLASALGQMDEKYLDFARAYFGLRKNDNIDSWNGKVVSFQEYSEILTKDYGKDEYEVRESWGENNDDVNSIQNKVGQKIDNSRSKTAYASLYAQLNGTDSKLGTGGKFTINNQKYSKFRGDVYNFIGSSISTNDSVIYFGDFQSTNPENDQDAVSLMDQYMAEIANRQDSKSTAKSSFTVTYLPIASGDRNYCGIHIQKDGVNKKDKDANGITIVVPKERVRDLKMVNSAETYWADQILFEYNQPIKLYQYTNTSQLNKNNQLDPSKVITLQYDRTKKQLVTSGSAYIVDEKENEFADCNFSQFTWVDRNGIAMSAEEVIAQIDYYIKKGQQYINQKYQGRTPIKTNK